MFREDYSGWYSQAMSKEDATGGIYRACGLLIIRLLDTNFLNICKAVADKMAVLFICTLFFLRNWFSFLCILLCCNLIYSSVCYMFVSFFILEIKQK